ncbi:MAG: Rieske 2Fe-2S domain-containing protein [Chloroflexi bacterium]|nr:Rieske 2Fe-2S domain-containing protein [Chloroflexota bacterium]
MTTVKGHIDYDALVLEDRVHGSIYTDPNIFEDEMDKIFHNWWLYVGHESEIPEPGDYRLTWIGRQSVIMSRDEDGNVQLFMNRCRHRANAVCQDEKGNANFFRCWFHGWTYSNKGDLIGVPYAGRYDDSFKKEDMGLTKAPRVDTYRGFIFGSLSPTGISLDDHLGHSKATIDAFIEASPKGQVVVRAGVHKGTYKGNWKFVGMDGYHPAFAHKAVNDLMQRKETGIEAKDRDTLVPSRSLEEAFGEHSLNKAWDLGGGHVRLDIWPMKRQVMDGVLKRLNSTEAGRSYLESMEQAYGKEMAREHIATQDPHVGIWPNLQLIGVQIRVIRPLSVNETEVFMYPTGLGGVPEEINEVRLREHEWFYGPASFGSPDDYEMFERNQMGLSAQVNPWLLVSRGLGQETKNPDGTIVGGVTDETPQRGQFIHWKKVMSGG